MKFSSISSFKKPRFHSSDAVKKGRNYTLEGLEKIGKSLLPFIVSRIEYLKD